MKAIDIKAKIDELNQQRAKLLSEIEPLQEQLKEELAKEALGENNKADDLRPKLETLKKQGEEIDLLLPVLVDKLNTQEVQEQKAENKKLLQKAAAVEKELKEKALPEFEGKLQELRETMNQLEYKQKQWRSLRTQAGESAIKEPPGPVSLQKELKSLLMIYERQQRQKTSRAG